MPDKEHIHHKLLDMNLEPRQILSLVLGLQIVSSFSILLFNGLCGQIRYLPVLIALLLVGTLFLYLHWDRHYKKK